MKIEQSNRFEPITITLETKEEAEIIKSVIGKIGGKYPGKVRSLTETIFDKLGKLGIITDHDGTYTEGSIKAKQ